MKQLFSLDGSIPPLQTLPQLFLLTDVRSLVSKLLYTTSIHVIATQVEKLAVNIPTESIITLRVQLC